MEKSPESRSWLRKHQAKLGWAAIGLFVAGYDAFCDEGETLSEGVDRALEDKKFRALALGGIAVTALHLANLLPEQIDPYSRLTKLKKKRRYE